MLFTDEWDAYRGLGGLPRPSPDRARSQVYAIGETHTQTVEGFFGLFKNGVRGVYHAVSTDYLQGYLDEYAFRYNRRDAQQPMFWAMLNRVEKGSPSFFLAWFDVALSKSRKKSASVWLGSCFTSRAGGVGAAFSGRLRAGLMGLPLHPRYSVPLAGQARAIRSDGHWQLAHGCPLFGCERAGVPGRVRTPKV